MAKDNAQRLIDAYLDQENNINSRPGLEAILGVGAAAAVDGYYWWNQKSAIVWVVNGEIYWSIDGITTNTVAGDDLQVGKKVTFATDGTNLFMANGGRIVVKVGLAGVPTYIADADAPTAVTHIAYIDGYLIANSVGSQRFFFSELEDYTSWSALDFASSGGDPDFTVAIHVFQKEIFMFGSISTELWQNDGVTPFSRVDGGFIETGCIAPYSINNSDFGLVWLNSKKQFVKYSGGSTELLPSVYDKEIQAYAVVSDCESEAITINGISFIKFDFPSENKTIVYNITADNWEEWGYWNAVSGAHDIFIGRCYAFSPLFNKHYFGSRKATGQSYEMSPDYFDDDGNPIKFISRSGKISYGTHKMKRCLEFSFRAKRGRVTDATEPVLTLRLKDDDIEWTNEMDFSLGAIGETYNVIREQNMGCYRNRQYEFSGTNAIGYALGDAKEEIYQDSK